MFYVASPNTPSGPQKIIPPQTRFLAGRKAGKRNSEGTQILPPMYKHGRNEFKGGSVKSGQDGNASPKEFGDIPWWVGVLFILSVVLIKPEIRHAIVAIISGGGQPGRAYAVTRNDSEVRQQISRFKEYSYSVSSHIPEIDINAYGFRLGEPRWSVISRCRDKGLRFSNPYSLDNGFSVDGVLAASGPTNAAVEFLDGRVSEVTFNFKASYETFKHLLNSLASRYERPGVQASLMDYDDFGIYNISPVISGKQVYIKLSFSESATNVGEERAKRHYDHYRLTGDPEDLRKGVQTQNAYDDEVRIDKWLYLTYEYTSLQELAR